MKEAKKQLLKDVAPRIKSVREACQYSQEKMANILGVIRTTLNRYEQGTLFPGPVTLLALANKMKVSLNWLFGGWGPMFFHHQSEGPEDPVAAAARGADIEALEAIPPDLKELWQNLERIPLLRHEILRCYYKFKLDYEDLIPAGKGTGQKNRKKT